MLKKIKGTDIDVLMNLWKKEYMSSKNKVDGEELTKKYTEVRDLFSNKNCCTILYTEDDVIEGFITVNENNKICLIYVDKKIRREGIGSVLVDSCKKIYDKLYVEFQNDDECYSNFFSKNKFKKINCEDNTDCENENIIMLEWNKNKNENVNLIYFDNDLDEKLINKESKINPNKIKIKDTLKEDKELKNIGNYIKIRKDIEKAFSKKVLLYLNCGNYNEILDDIIKEIVKIEKAELTVVVCEPLIIENSKMEINFEKIERSFKDYKLYQIDTMTDIKKDISVNKILEEKMKVIINKIEKIAQNM